MKLLKLWKFVENFIVLLTSKCAFELEIFPDQDFLFELYNQFVIKEIVSAHLAKPLSRIVNCKLQQMWKRNKQEKNTLQCCKHLFDLRTFILFPNNAANTGDQERVNIVYQDLSTNISFVCKNSLRRQALLLATTSNINRMALFLIFIILSFLDNSKSQNVS